MAERSTPTSWMSLKKGTSVLAADGSELGRVTEVVADRQKDIFSGIAFRHGVLGTDRFAPANVVGTLTDDAVHLTITAGEAEEALEAYEA